MDAARNTTTSPSAYYKECMAHNVNGNVTEPFWDGLPYTNIFTSQTSDVLHQLYQGVVKYLIEWCQVLLTEQELDRRIRRMPQALGLRHFKNGISALSQISGTKRKNMAKLLLGCIVDELHPRAITACRAVLDFVYLAQYPTHDDDTLTYLTDALALWHAHKDYFIQIGVRDQFELPKFHSLEHYVETIKLFGVTNNYNTEMFERLHIDFSKKGWHASNKRDEFTQMTTWVTRRENVHRFERYLKWAAQEHAALQRLLIPKNPTCPRKDIRIVALDHQVPSFPTHLLQYINGVEHDKALYPLEYNPLPFGRIDMYHSFKFSHEGSDDNTGDLDWVKATPTDGGRYDTVVILDGPDADAFSLEGVFR
ncbi:hypothetical protein CYLTODRAFT_362860 [Cylindrobasidium torrendii FP15055 ss-10]|uniref:Uncharacterized protein n=1 Tax=Cylindrobasidium torrendii FP15055 ss-10 TaxID=1314674 RepID=A0A0D7ATB7_9AGAR|nr:hypothetical protein CYLTODRAFT_362860 [Cylindrobasidium torrendii FP15055 ss-10]